MPLIFCEELFKRLKKFNLHQEVERDHNDHLRKIDLNSSQVKSVTEDIQLMR